MYSYMTILLVGLSQQIVTKQLVPQTSAEPALKDHLNLLSYNYDSYMHLNRRVRKGVAIGPGWVRKEIWIGLCWVSSPKGTRNRKKYSLLFLLVKNNGERGGIHIPRAK